MDINDLYKRACRGDKTSEKKLFEILVVRFRHFLSRRIRENDDIEDIVQESLMTIAAEYKTISIEKSFAAWAYKILDYRVLSFISKQKRRKEREQFFSDDNPDIFTVSETGLLNQLLSCLKKIHRVNVRHARVLNLKYQGFSTEEICGKLDISRDNLYIMLFRARNLLSHCLETGDIKQ